MNVFNLIKGLYENATANIFNGKKLNIFSLRPETIKSVLFNIVQEVLARTLRQEKEIKRYPDRRGVGKTTSFYRYHDLV